MKSDYSFMFINKSFPPFLYIHNKCSYDEKKTIKIIKFKFIWKIFILWILKILCLVIPPKTMNFFFAQYIYTVFFWLRDKN